MHIRHMRIIVAVLAQWLLSQQAYLASGFQIVPARVPNVAARHSSRVADGQIRRGLPLLKMANIDAAPEVRPRPRAMRWTLANLSACLCTGVTNISASYMGYICYLYVNASETRRPCSLC
jgi:hypothetical protein